MPAKLVIRNNRIILVNPLEFDKHDRLLQMLSTWDNVSHSVDTKYVKYVANNKMAIPRYFTKEEGASIFKGLSVLREEDLYVQHIAGIDFKWRSSVVLDDQLQNKGLHYMKVNRNCVLNTQPGSGKTIMVLKHIAETRVKALIVMEKKMIKHWVEKIKFTMGIEDDEVMVVSGASSLAKIISKKTDVSDVKIFIATHGILSNLIDDRASKYDDLLTRMKVGMWVVDEAHKKTKTLFALVSRTDIKHNIFLTATIARADWKEKKILNKILPLARFNEDKANVTISKHITFAFAEYTTKPTEDQIETISKSRWKGMNVDKWSKWAEDGGWYPYSEKLLELITRSSVKVDGKIVIIFNRISIIEKFIEELENNEHTKDLKLAKVFGKHRDDYQDDGVKVIIAMDSIFRDGMDVANLQVLINSVPFSSETTSIQTSGRLRNIPGKMIIYIDVIDTAFPQMKTQRTARRRAFKRYAKEFINLT